MAMFRTATFHDDQDAQTRGWIDADFTSSLT
jgi:hypothetical protein